MRAWSSIESKVAKFRAQARPDSMRICKQSLSLRDLGQFALDIGKDLSTRGAGNIAIQILLEAVKTFEECGMRAASVQLAEAKQFIAFNVAALLMVSKRGEVIAAGRNWTWENAQDYLTDAKNLYKTLGLDAELWACLEQLDYSKTLNCELY